jgi:hypothetical protein
MTGRFLHREDPCPTTEAPSVSSISASSAPCGSSTIHRSSSGSSAPNR